MAFLQAELHVDLESYYWILRELESLECSLESSGLVLEGMEWWEYDWVDWAPSVVEQYDLVTAVAAPGH